MNYMYQRKKELCCLIKQYSIKYLHIYWLPLDRNRALQ